MSASKINPTLQYQLPLLHADVKIIQAPTAHADSQSFDYLPLVLIALLAGIVIFLARR